MAVASSMTSYITSNFITGEGLEENVRIEASIAGVREHDFGDDAKSEAHRRSRRRSSRLAQPDAPPGVITACGPNPANWVGKTVTVSRGTTTYAGKPAACVVVEPVVATRIAAAGANSPLERRIATIGSGGTRHRGSRPRRPSLRPITASRPDPILRERTPA